MTSESAKGSFFLLVEETGIHSVWKLQKKSHSTLRAKRATFLSGQKFIKNWPKMPKLKNSNETFWVIFKHCGIVVRHPSGMPSKQEFDRRVIESSTTQVSTSLLSVFATHKSTKEKGKTIFGVTLIFHEYTLCTHLAKCTLWRHWIKYTQCTNCI